MADLQARIGFKISPHRSWVRPGYKPPKAQPANKFKQQHQSTNAAGYESDSSSHDDNFARDSSPSKARAASGSLLQRMGLTEADAPPQVQDSPSSRPLLDRVGDRVGIDPNTTGKALFSDADDPGSPSAPAPTQHSDMEIDSPDGEDITMFGDSDTSKENGNMTVSTVNASDETRRKPLEGLNGTLRDGQRALDNAAVIHGPLVTKTLGSNLEKPSSGPLSPHPAVSALPTPPITSTASPVDIVSPSDMKKNGNVPPTTDPRRHPPLRNTTTIPAAPMDKVQAALHALAETNAHQRALQTGSNSIPSTRTQPFLVNPASVTDSTSTTSIVDKLEAAAASLYGRASPPPSTQPSKTLAPGDRSEKGYTATAKRDDGRSSPRKRSSLRYTPSPQRQDWKDHKIRSPKDRREDRGRRNSSRSRHSRERSRDNSDREDSRAWFEKSRRHTSRDWKGKERDRDRDRGSIRDRERDRDRAHARRSPTPTRPLARPPRKEYVPVNRNAPPPRRRSSRSRSPIRRNTARSRSRSPHRRISSTSASKKPSSPDLETRNRASRTEQTDQERKRENSVDARKSTSVPELIPGSDGDSQRLPLEQLPTSNNSTGHVSPHQNALRSEPSTEQIVAAPAVVPPKPATPVPQVPPCHYVPGVWAFKAGLPRVGVTSLTFDVDSQTQLKWNLNRKLSSPPVEPTIEPLTTKHQTQGTLSLQICCLFARAVNAEIEKLGTLFTPSDVATTLLSLEKTWPPQGHLVITMNNDIQKGRWLPDHLGKSSAPIEIQDFIQEGTNTIEFIQLSDMSEYLFVILATEGPPKQETPKQHPIFISSLQEHDTIKPASISISRSDSNKPKP